MTSEQLKRLHFEAQFNEAVTSVENYYAIGREAWRMSVGGGAYAPGVCSSIGEKYGVGSSLISRARTVAREYSQDRLQEVISKCHANDFIPRREMFAMLATIPKDERERWEDAIIAKRWSIRDLQLEMLEAFGRRSNGKKFHKLPVNLKEAVHKVGRIRKHWRELSYLFKEVLSRPFNEAHELQLPFTLSPDLYDDICRVTKALDQMHEALQRERWLGEKAA